MKKKSKKTDNTTIDNIIGYNKVLIPAMVREKYRLMNKDEFRFLRATNHLFYEELRKEKMIPFSPAVWTCGDLHLENFGSYKGDNRLVYFDLNDFDEALLAPACWELIRFVTSIFIGFETKRIERQKAINMAQLFLKVYAETLAGGKSFYLEPRTAKGIVRSFLTAVSRRTQQDMLEKRTVLNKKKRTIRITKKYLKLDEGLKKKLSKHIEQWINYSSGTPYNYEVADVVFRRVGLGSLGLRRYMFLLKSTNKKEEYLLIDMKESREPCHISYVTVAQPVWKSQSERVIAIQRRMQNVPQALLSETVFEGVSYVIHELQPMRDSINVNSVKDRYRDIYQIINDMAVLTASAQLRSSGRQGSATADELILFGTHQQWQEEVLALASKMAGRVRADYQEFRKAYKNGRLKTKSK